MHAGKQDDRRSLSDARSLRQRAPRLPPLAHVGERRRSEARCVSTGLGGAHGTDAWRGSGSFPHGEMVRVQRENITAATNVSR